MSLIRNHSLITGNYHPFYKAILSRAMDAGYNLPTQACRALQNRFVKELASSGVWALLDYLHVYADDSNAVDMCRINWRQPSLGLSTNTPIHVSKKGIYGNIDHAFTAPIHYINISSANNRACQFCYLTEGSGSTTQVNNLVALNAANLGSQRIQTIRLRTNPRTDFLLNATTAGVQVIYNGAPVDNHFYYIDVGSVAGDVTLTAMVNTTLTIDLGPTATGTVPDAGTLQTGTVQSDKQVGLIGGGYSLRESGAKHLILEGIVRRYMTSVQAL